MKDKVQSKLKEALLSCVVMFKYALLFGAIINLLMLSTPIYSMQVLDRVISSGNTDTLLMLTLVIAGALLLLVLLQAARSFAMTQMGTWLEHKLSATVFTNSIKISVSNQLNIGSQKMRDLQTIKNYLTSPQLLVMMDTPWAIIFIIVLFMLHTYIGFIALVGGIILIFLGIISDRMTRELHESYNDLNIKSMRQVEQATRNAEVVSVMGLQNNIISNWQKTNSRLQNTHSLVNKRQTVMTELTKFIRFFLQISVTGFGAYLVIKHELTPGAIIASSAMIGRALAPFEATINAWKQFIKCRQSYDRLNKGFHVVGIEERKIQFPRPLGNIKAEGVYYAPHGSRKHIVSGINFEIQEGQSLAIIGPSGSGKTTLAKLIVGGCKAAIGQIRIDGVNLEDFNKEELGQYIGYLPQSIELFNGTARENIARMDKHADSEKVIKAAQLAGAHDMILNLPKGYDTDIGADGSLLSGGQRQRLGLARAFFNDPAMIVLDEPNSNLDQQGEVSLFTAMEAAKEQKITLIIISHRTSVLNFVDKILILRNGVIASFGDKKQIMAQMAGQSLKAVDNSLPQKPKFTMSTEDKH